MLIDVILKISPKNPSVGYVLLEGLNTVGAQRLDFAVEESKASREEAIDKARQARCALASALLGLPYFKAVSVFSLKDTDCIALVLRDGKKWEDSIGEKSTIESFLPQLILKNYKNLTAVIGTDERIDLEELKGKMDSFVRNHPLQKIVENDEGSIAFDNFDPATGTLTLRFGGKCSSSSTCVGNQTISKSVISRACIIEFPNHVKQMNFS
jgi:Fe-S cluster biogenesis protein NfuA